MLSLAFRRDGFFKSGLYNKEGKPHDVGSDFGLTSDVYTKPNPYYTKNANKNKLQPVYNPVYNHSAGQEAAGSVTEEVYDSPPTSYDYKTNSYPSPSYAEPTSPDLSAYNVQSVPSTGYGIPNPSYGAGVSSYYPQTSYGTSPSSYNSPQTSYGSSHQTSHGSPYNYVSPSYYPSSTAMASKYPEAQKSHSGWFITKLMKKFDLILMSKILLKLIIFKKIVKFIGVICLLMFLPMLKKKWDGDDDEERRIKELDAFCKNEYDFFNINEFHEIFYF